MNNGPFVHVINNSIISDLPYYEKVQNLSKVTWELVALFSWLFMHFLFNKKFATSRAKIAYFISSCFSRTFCTN